MAKDVASVPFALWPFVLFSGGYASSYVVVALSVVLTPRLARKAEIVCKLAPCGGKARVGWGGCNIRPHRR